MGLHLTCIFIVLLVYHDYRYAHLGLGRLIPWMADFSRAPFFRVLIFRVHVSFWAMFHRAFGAIIPWHYLLNFGCHLQGDLLNIPDTST